MGKKKGFFQEFKEFISRGNVMNLAVGVIIGGAFQAIVTSLIDDIINPVLGFVLGGLDFSSYAIALGSGAEPPMIKYGSFISAIINFLIMALVIFMLVKTVNKLVEKSAPKKEEEPAAPTTKKCPYCKSEIPLEATKCAFCTSDVE